MANISRSLGSFLIVVAFLVLTALAAVLYGGSETQKEKAQQNVYWQTARVMADAFWATLSTVSDATPTNNVPGASNFLSAAESRFQNEWQTNDTATALSDFHNFINLEKTDKGMIIDFRSKSGGEYKLPLSWDFIKR